MLLISVLADLPFTFLAMLNNLIYQFKLMNIRIFEFSEI